MNVRIGVLAATMALVSACNESSEVSCVSDRECSSRAQICDRGASRCVDCASDLDCFGPGEVCRANRCMIPTPCDTSRDCPGLVCDLDRAICVECVADRDCPDAQTCDPDGVCMTPTTCTDAECQEIGTLCDETRGRCVACLEPADCGANRTCVSNRCVLLSDGGRDAGPRTDAGHDAGPRTDAGRDAGPRDAGPRTDAGPPRCLVPGTVVSCGSIVELPTSATTDVVGVNHCAASPFAGQEHVFVLTADRAISVTATASQPGSDPIDDWHLVALDGDCTSTAPCLDYSGTSDDFQTVTFELAAGQQAYLVWELFTGGVIGTTHLEVSCTDL